MDFVGPMVVILSPCDDDCLVSEDGVAVHGNDGDVGDGELGEGGGGEEREGEQELHKRSW